MLRPLSCLGLVFSFTQSTPAELHCPEDGEIHGLGGGQQASAPDEIPQEL